MSVTTADRADIDSGRGLPERFCNYERLLATMEARDLDGLVVYTRPNVFYLSGYASRSAAAAAETSGYAAVFISRTHPDHPVVVLPDWDLQYFYETPSWITDRRVYATLQLPLGLPADDAAFDRFVTPEVSGTAWGAHARSTYSDSFGTACGKVMTDLGLTRGRIGFDDLRFAGSLTHDLPDVEVVDAYGAMKFVRQVKTPEEIEILTHAARVNEAILQHTMNVWRAGMTWRDLTTAYHIKCAELGGFVRDPGAIVVGNRGADDWSFPMVGRSSEDYVIQAGDSMMWDCHGTFNGYCWDGGKTWVVEGERQGREKQIELAAIEAMKQIESRMVPGASLAELQRIGLETIRSHGVPDPDRALIFFHGLGLEHGDLEVSTLARGDVSLEKDMVMSMHVVYPGGPRERFYIEDNALVTEGGGRSLYSWGAEPFH